MAPGSALGLAPSGLRPAVCARPSAELPPGGVSLPLRPRPRRGHMRTSCSTGPGALLVGLIGRWAEVATRAHESCVMLTRGPAGIGVSPIVVVVYTACVWPPPLANPGCWWVRSMSMLVPPLTACRPLALTIRATQRSCCCASASKHESAWLCKRNMGVAMCMPVPMQMQMPYMLIQCHESPATPTTCAASSQ